MVACEDGAPGHANDDHRRLSEGQRGADVAKVLNNKQPGNRRCGGGRCAHVTILVWSPHTIFLFHSLQAKRRIHHSQLFSFTNNDDDMIYTHDCNISSISLLIMESLGTDQPHWIRPILSTALDHWHTTWRLSMLWMLSRSLSYKFSEMICRGRLRSIIRR